MNFSNWDDFDITFCNYKDCPKWKTCHRALTEEKNRKAGKLGIRYFSMFLVEETENCKYYWEEK